MNVNSVVSLAPSYWLPFNSAANAGILGTASSIQSQADVSTLSPAGQFLNQLQQFKTQSPQEYQAILTKITGQLQQAASTASATGNTAQASKLTELANSFQNAASGGALPGVQQLQQAGISGFEHRHATRPANAVSLVQTATNAYSQNQNQSLAASIFGSI
jgi:hypothetical protein